MGSRVKQRAVRAFFEVTEKGQADPVFVSRDRVLSDPELLSQVELDLRRNLLDVINDAEGLDLNLSTPWWMPVVLAARRDPREGMPS